MEEDGEGDVCDFELLPKEDESKPAFRGFMAPRMMMMAKAPRPAGGLVAAGGTLAGKKHKPHVRKRSTASGTDKTSVGGNSYTFQQSQQSQLFSPMAQAQPDPNVQGEVEEDEEEEEEEEDDYDQEMGCGVFGDSGSAASSGGTDEREHWGQSTKGESPTLALASLQQFQGNWSWSDKLENVLGLSKEEAQRTIAGEPRNELDDVVATLCVVAFLKKRQLEDADVWELFVEKAERWVLQQMGGIEEDVKRLEKDLQGLF